MAQLMQILGSGLTALASLAAIIMFFMGIYAILAGRITLCAECLTGNPARKAGVILALVLPISWGVVILFGGPLGVDWRVSPGRILIPIITTAVVLAAAFGALHFVRKTAAETA